jgi:transposase
MDIVGIDIAKAKFDAARNDRGKVTTWTNDVKGIEAFIASLTDTTPRVIVVEATGGYESMLAAALLEAELPVAVANPAQVRHFAKGMGILAKTDAIDAAVLLKYAQQASPRLAEKREKNQLELQELVTCRRQLVHVRTEQRNRLRGNDDYATFLM